MTHIEHFLFFPVVVLLALVLIALTWRLIVRFFALFVLIMILWYLLYLAGALSSPYRMFREERLTQLQRMRERIR